MSAPAKMNVDDLVAIDIHTHAEEPCGCHADDGYDDFQARMAEYFNRRTSIRRRSRRPPRIIAQRKSPP